MYKNRPVPAETLILEAMAAYQKLDDPHGLGSANREYGDFLTSQAVVNWERAYSRHGFFDRTVTYENRSEKAKEHYSKALEYYRVAEARRAAGTDPPRGGLHLRRDRRALRLDADEGQPLSL